MKKALALILAVLCMFTVCGCGDDKGNTGSGSSGNTNVGTGDNNQSDDNSVNDVNHETFDDLTKTQRLAAYDIYFDVPGSMYTEARGKGFTSNDALDCTIAVSASREIQPGISVESDFADVFNDSYHGVLNDFNNFRYDDYTPDTTGTVTLPCGSEAIKFEGIQPAELYGTKKECSLYGYSFVFNDVLVIVGYSVTEGKGIDDAKKAELANYVDEMVRTIRTQP